MSTTILFIVDWTDKKKKDYRMLGRTGWKVPTISLGTWAMSSPLGAVDDRESLATLNRALDLGVNFFDTADVYGSEPLLAQLRKQRYEPFCIATKIVRKTYPHNSSYNRRNLTAFVESSLRNLQTETIDLMQLHGLPIAVLTPRCSEFWKMRKFLILPIEFQNS